MRKTIVSSVFVLIFSAYILWATPDVPPVQEQGTVSSYVPVATSTVVGMVPAISGTSTATVQSKPAVVISAPVTTSLPSVPPPVPAPRPQGQYRDGTYAGPAIDAVYGTVQVQATVSGGKLTDVQFLQYPSDRGTSRMINGQAMPYLIQEAIQAQSANVNIVSGATDTSMSFQQSLGAALAQAKA